MLIAQIPTVGQIRCIFDDNYGIFFIISQSGDSNEHHRLIFLRGTDQSCVLVTCIINIRASTDKLEYRKSTVFCMQNIVIEK